MSFIDLESTISTGARNIINFAQNNKTYTEAVISTEGTTPGTEEVDRVGNQRSRNLVPSEKTYYVYLMTNWNNKVMYIGMTNDLAADIRAQK